MRHSISADMNRLDRFFSLIKLVGIWQKRCRWYSTLVVVAIPIDCIYSRGESRDKTSWRVICRFSLFWDNGESNLEISSVRKSIAFRFAKQVNSMGRSNTLDFMFGRSHRFSWAISFEFGETVANVYQNNLDVCAVAAGAASSRTKSHNGTK